MTTNGIRPGFTTVTPYLTVANVEALVHFLKTAFAAEETHCSSDYPAVPEGGSVWVFALE